jgi:hypothetical protein
MWCWDYSISINRLPKLSIFPLAFMSTDFQLHAQVSIPLTPTTLITMSPAIWRFKARSSGSVMRFPQQPSLFRASLNLGSDFKWAELIPPLQVDGTGDVCIPFVQAPKFANYTGAKRFLQMVTHTPNVIYYQVSYIFLTHWPR